MHCTECTLYTRMVYRTHRDNEFIELQTNRVRCVLHVVWTFGILHLVYCICFHQWQAHEFKHVWKCENETKTEENGRIHISMGIENGQKTKIERFVLVCAVHCCWLCWLLYAELDVYVSVCLFWIQLNWSDNRKRLNASDVQHKLHILYIPAI